MFSSPNGETEEEEATKENEKSESNEEEPAVSPFLQGKYVFSETVISDGKPCGVESVFWFGRTSKGTQISSLKSGVDIVIGTPGRLKDLIEMGLCCFQEVSFAVLDEADRMLDMRFELEVRYILGQTC
ncbi:hypothetical protein ACLB2K_047366 [Fragaria x ananassa]